MTEKEPSPLQLLYELRFTYSDEIPSQILHSDMPGQLDPPKFKVRRIWFTGVAICLSNILDEGLIQGPELRKEVQKYLDTYSKNYDNETTKPIITTRAEIDNANSLIDKVLGVQK